MSNLRQSLDPKHCPVAPGTADVPRNPPGQGAIAYRLGTWSEFFTRMREGLGTATVPDGPNAGRRPLARLEEDFGDPAVALLDAWAVTADVLTFYQERIANEFFLRTATEDRSVAELTRLVGHRVGPGVAAGSVVAFKVEDAPGAPASAVVPVGTRLMSIPGQDEMPQTFEIRERIVARGAWNALTPRLSEPQDLSAARELFLAGVGTNLVAGNPLLLVAGAERVVARVLTVEIDTDGDRTRIGFEEPLPEGFGTAGDAAGTDVGVFALREQAAVFGHNAPLYGSLPREDFVKNDPFTSADPANNWDAGRTVWTDSRGRLYADATSGLPALFLDRKIDALVPGGWVVLAGTTLAATGAPATRRVEVFPLSAVTVASLADYALAGEVSGLVLGGLAEDLAGRTPFDLRKTVAYLVSEPLARAEKPITEPYPDPVRDAFGARIVLSGLVEGLRPGQLLALAGERLDGGGPEERVLRLRKIDAESVPGHTVLTFLEAVDGTLFDRSTVTLNANVTRATHGETVEEILGSGDAGVARQSFRLSRSPLTFDSAARPGGIASSLRVRVAGVLWQEVETLYGEGSDAQVYTVEVDASGRATLTFGDGVHGARLPAGQENVVATYRFGIGSAGEVGAGSLALLTTRPLGIASVANPLAASGAASRESLAEARRNAPVTVRTRGRIVSLSDFEDFALAFAGIARARAVPLGGVHLTVAGVGGAAVVPGSVLFDNLCQAIEAVRLPGPALCLQSYQPLLFNVLAKLFVDPRFRPEDVFAEVRAAVLDAWSFERRDLARPVYASEVIRVIQDVPGVLAVDLDALHVSDRAPSLATRLEALPARPGGGGVLPAELLRINPEGITLGVRTL